MLIFILQLNLVWAQNININANESAFKNKNKTLVVTTQVVTNTNLNQAENYSETNPTNVYPTLSGYIKNRTQNNNFIENKFPNNNQNSETSNKNMNVMMNNSCVICM